jgi:hypothetical protein
MQELRIDDPARKPRGYMEILRPGQFVVFAKDGVSGRPTDAHGTPMTAEAAVCYVSDSLAEARETCEAAVQRSPSTQFDVFDAEGRVHPPLLTIVHPSSVTALESDPRTMKRRRAIAWCLIVAGVPFVAFAAWRYTDLEAIVPAIVGFNLMFGGGRLLWVNMGIRETERARRERLDRLER